MALQAMVHKLHIIHTARHVAYPLARDPADLRKGAPSPVPVEPQPPWGRTSTTVDGSGPSLSATPTRAIRLSPGPTWRGRVGRCCLNDKCNYQS